jgi:tripartite-type tricarboxylate transporter receptor subunit TctC
MSIQSHFVRALVACAVVALPASSSHAQNYPTQPVKIIVQSPAGNGPDITARQIADKLGQIWKQQVLVLNRPGGGGMIAAQAAVAAPADGTTLYMPNSSTMLVLPVTHAPLPFDLDKDFKAIGLVGIGPMVLAVAPSFGVKSVAELIAKAKAEPGKLNYSAIGRGTLPHIASLVFLHRAGIDMTYVPYTSTSQVLQDVMGGRHSIVFDGFGALAGALDAGTVRPLALTSEKRLAHRPELPVIAETLPGYAVHSWLPLLAPGGTPDAIVERVATALRTVLADKEIEAKFRLSGLEIRQMSPKETASFIRSERAKWRPMLERIGLKPEKPAK